MKVGDHVEKLTFDGGRWIGTRRVGVVKSIRSTDDPKVIGAIVVDWQNVPHLGASAHHTHELRVLDIIEAVGGLDLIR